MIIFTGSVIILVQTFKETYEKRNKLMIFLAQIGVYKTFTEFYNDLKSMKSISEISN